VSERRAAALGATARGIAAAAFLIALGNIASRVLGLGRMSAIAFFFGRTPEVDAFAAAWTIPITVYDLLINGAISAALIPVLSEYAEGDPREFWQVVLGVASVALLALTALISLLVWQAPLVVRLLIEDPDLRPLTTTLVRWLLPAVLLMGLSGLMTAVLYARQTFLLPAFAGAVFNLGIIAGAVLFHDALDIRSLAVGVLLGALGQVALQAPGLRGMRARVGAGIRHPAVRRILWLYAPVALGIGFSVVGTLIDRRLASGFETALATMQFATTLIQFPLGLVAAAISLAVLPTLSRQSASADEEAFRRTLGMGLKVVLLLVLPATAGLAALANPITTLLFEYGAFEARDTAITATTLLFYLPSLPAAALDQLLIFAFYARRNTLTPNLVQGAAILIYLATALLLLALLREQLGFRALVIGNSAQWIGHALLLWWLLRRHVSFKGLRLGEAAGKALLASGLMALLVYGLATWALPPLLGSASSFVAALVTLLVAGGAGTALYVALSAALRVEALGFFLTALRQRLRRGRG
jgi:putative peptidoglycan lipid II flippase